VRGVEEEEEEEEFARRVGGRETGRRGGKRIKIDPDRKSQINLSELDAKVNRRLSRHG
jgi:hypothetical protein